MGTEGKKMSRAKMTAEGESAARNRGRAIVACADPKIRQLLTSVLSEFRLHPVLPETLDDAKRLIIQEETAIAFVQPRFSDGTFLEVLGVAECPKSPVPVIVCSEFYDMNIHIEAMSMGAFDYLAFPFRREEVAWVVNHAIGRDPPSPSTRAQGEA
jgi:DNA-binding NtrC family response regulator